MKQKTKERNPSFRVMFDLAPDLHHKLERLIDRLQTTQSDVMRRSLDLFYTLKVEEAGRKVEITGKSGEMKQVIL